MSRDLLIIEDSDEDFQVVVRCLKRTEADVCVSRSINGDDAVDMMRNASANALALPDVILLDLNLPGTDGRDVLREIKLDLALRAIPIIILSTSGSSHDIVECFRGGASGYCVKPFDRYRFEDTIRSINEYWLKHVSLPQRAFLS